MLNDLSQGFAQQVETSLLETDKNSLAMVLEEQKQYEIQTAKEEIRRQTIDVSNSTSGGRGVYHIERCH